MKTKLVNGTSVELLSRWILAIENDIEEHNFYCFSDQDDRLISSLNKARLLVMYDIFHISSNNYLECQSDYFSAYKDSVEDYEETVLDYLQTMKSLLEIKGKKFKTKIIMKIKHVIAICVAMFLFAILVIEINQLFEYKPEKEQYEKLVYQMDKLNCQDSLVVSDETHDLVIKDLSSQLYKIDHSALTKPYLTIGTVSYRFLSISREINKTSYEFAFGQDTTDISPWIRISFSKEQKSFYLRNIMTIKMLCEK